MRTTIEMRPEHRARLLEIAARRGEKGFSSIVEDAIESFLSREDQRKRAIERALEMAGSLDDEEANHLRVATQRGTGALA